MGVSKEALGLLGLARVSGADFSRVITIGRQRLDVEMPFVEQFFRDRGRGDLATQLAGTPGDGYCESLLKIAFGAGVIQSIDASDYEHADIIHDMNTPITIPERYSLVADFGTIEHVFNVPVALDNVAMLARPGAFILHMLPSNNFVGHGFYQFSPELFFQVYAAERGFDGTRVFVAPGGTPDLWYEVRSPKELGRRVDITSRDQLHVMVLTRKIGESVSLTQRPVQQSDYVETWNKGASKAKVKRLRSGFERHVRDAFSGVRQQRKVDRKDLRRSRGDLVPRPLRNLVPNF
ncbi:methyltransferase domain-containing protein [Terricaulis silvestris]|uniref:Class I SAM-dependent methyltransferase n=1 Tax=Terricaulis silvestris TaxID=2686094 RepID=A0A6I6MSJ0_9CAUL|nr:hypothetical protein [Terricaulis silvestris]QGZ94652.1 hypothetical protein DSM104635_01479 [Terricaulis silvestris]